MDKILSQDEVNALLNSEAAAKEEPDSISESSRKPSGRTDAPPAKRSSTAQARPITVYNFRRPDRVPKSMLRSLQFLHDEFCADLSASLSAYLRAMVEVNLASLDQTTYGEFVASLSDPTCLCSIGMKPLNGEAALEIPLDLAFPLIDRLLGGSGSLPKLERNITEIEKSIVQGIIGLVTSNLIEAWKPVGQIHFEAEATETRPQLLQIASPNEVMILFVFEVKLGDTRGMLHLCLPYSALEPISGKFHKELNIRRKGSSLEDRRRLVRALCSASMPISADLLGGEVTVKELVSIKVGDILRLDQRVGEQLDIQLSGRSFFEGEPIVINHRRAIRIVEGAEEQPSEV